MRRSRWTQLFGVCSEAAVVAVPVAADRGIEGVVVVVAAAVVA